MTWWCVPLREAWHWQWQGYPGVWLLFGGLAGSYLWAQRHRPDRRRGVRFLAGVVAAWAVTDWPFGTLAAGYLASAHVVQYLVYVFVAAPLLLLGIPEWMARRVLAQIRGYGAVRALARPLRAAALFNIVMVVTHSPVVVDTVRSSAPGAFLLDLVWLASGVLVWIPVCGPLPELRVRSSPLRIGYLWLAAGFLTWVPGSFLVFADFPLYRTYELAPRALGLDAVTDQRIAGLAMKLGPAPIVWGAITVMWWRWAQATSAPARRT